MNNKLFIFMMCITLVFTFVACAQKTENSEKTDTKESVETTDNSEDTKEDTATEESKEETVDESVTKLADKQVFVKPDFVKALIDGKTDYDNFVVAEVTWGEAKDSPDYLKEHIPGAIHFNTDLVEEGPVWNYRAPLEIEKNFLANGVTSDTFVLIYGPDLPGASRVAQCMLYMGVKNVKILDGGLNAWKNAGYETEEGEVKPNTAEEFGVEVPAHPEYVLSLEDVQNKLKDSNFRLVSIRSEEEWKGETSGYSYIPKAGEPKGAVWGKSGEGNSGMEYYVNDDGTVKDFADIEAMWKEQGFDTSNELSFYCGTGWRAALPWLMMYEHGYDSTLFDGGWNEWQMHDELEAQVGDPKDPNFEILKVKDLPNDKALK